MFAIMRFVAKCSLLKIQRGGVQNSNFRGELLKMENFSEKNSYHASRNTVFAIKNFMRVFKIKNFEIKFEQQSILKKCSL